MKWIRFALIGLAGIAAALALAIAVLPSQRYVKSLILGAFAASPYEGLAEVQAGTDTPVAARVITGERAELYGGTLETWAGLDARGQVIQVGLTLPLSSIQRSPLAMASAHDHRGQTTMRMDRRTLRYPELVRAQTLFDTLDLYYAPLGHGPERYARAHFDLHFFSKSPEQIRGIDCTDTTETPLSRLPSSFQEGVAPGKTFGAMCEPQMGVHAVAVREFLGRFGPFEADLLIPHYGGEPIGLEPMIARAKLLERQSFGGALPEINYWPGARALPTRFAAIYDHASDSYRIIFTGFRSLRDTH